MCLTSMYLTLLGAMSLHSLVIMLGVLSMQILRVLLLLITPVVAVIWLWLTLRVLILMMIAGSGLVRLASILGLILMMLLWGVLHHGVLIEFI